MRDQADPFLRTVIQVRLVGELPEFIVSTCDTCEVKVTGFLREVVCAYQFLSVRFSREYLNSITRKRLKRDLVECLFPVPMYRSLFSDGTDRDVLSRVKRMLVPGSVKTFYFKLHTNTLPVKTWLAKKGMFVPWGEDCFLCKKPETVEHVFLDCWDAILFWDVLQRTLKKDLPLTARGIRFLSVEGTPFPYDLVFLLGLHAIWRCRMAVRHADLNARPVRYYFIENVNLIAAVYEKVCSELEWLPAFLKLSLIREF